MKGQTENVILLNRIEIEKESAVSRQLKTQSPSPSLNLSKYLLCLQSLLSVGYYTMEQVKSNPKDVEEIEQIRTKMCPKSSDAHVPHTGEESIFYYSSS